MVEPTTNSAKVGQISQILNTRPIGGFPSDTKVAKGATHEKCKAITTRSGKILMQTNKQRGTAASPLAAIDKPAEADEPAETREDHYDPHSTSKGESSAESSHTKPDKSEEIRPPPQFQQRLNKEKHDYQFKKFFDILKQVHINLPLVEALQQMPNYTKFSKTWQPARANLNWVLEFYTNNAAGEDNVTVRGRRVAANATTINEILGLPNNDPSIYALLGRLEDEDYETIKDYLCEEGTTWNTTGGNHHSVSRPNLRPEAKLWNTFVKRTLMPTSHNQTVDRTRLVLINVIITGFHFNVGEVFAQELATACRNDKGILAFPCIITSLFRRAAVPAYPRDKHTVEKPGWSRKEYMRKMDIVDATPIRIAMPTPPTSPVCSTVAAHDEAGPSAPAEAQPSPPASPPIVPVSSHTSTKSLTTTPAAMPANREATPDSPLGSAPITTPSPPLPSLKRQSPCTSYSCVISCNRLRPGSSNSRQKQRYSDKI
ncbi:hypothetical protein GQ457_11G025130 [Hibiscus cannabinus]